MSSSAAQTYNEHEEMLRSFRCQDLANLLTYAGQSKNGKKMELLDRCLNILKKGNANVQLKIREIYNYKITTASTYSNLISAVNSNSNSGSNSPDPNSMIMNGRYQPPTNYPNPNYNQYANHPGLHLQSGFGAMHHNNHNTRSAGAVSSVYNQTPSYRVQFESLAFFEFLHELHMPIQLKSLNTQHGRPNALSFNFFMTTDQANEITGTRELNNGKLEYQKQIHLRFGHYDREPQVDNLPANLIVSVNSKPATLPPPKPTSKPNADIIRPGRSIDVTTLCRLAPNMPNKVDLNWTNPDPSKPYAIGVYVFKKLSVQFLIKNLKTRLLNAEATRQMVREKLQITDSDFEIETSDLKVSLMCPLMKFRMNMPGRSNKCKHVQCFDLESYLMMNEKKPTWNCPVCDRNAPFDDLIIDTLNQEIIKESGTDCEEVVFAADGSWKKVTANDGKSKSEDKKKAEVSNDDDMCVELICDDTPEKEVQQPKTTESVVNPPPPVIKKNLCVIDLTLDSSDEDSPEPVPAQAQTASVTQMDTDVTIKKQQLSVDDSTNLKISNTSNQNNLNNMRLDNEETAASPNNSIISISSSNSDSRPASPVKSIVKLTPDTQIQQKPDSNNKQSPLPAPNNNISNNHNTSPKVTPNQVNKPNSRSSSVSSSNETPMDVTMKNRAKSQQIPGKNTTPTLSNSQLARGLSIGAPPNTRSPSDQISTPVKSSSDQIPKAAYSNSFTKSSNSLSSISSIIDNSNLTRHDMAPSNTVNPNQHNSPHVRKPIPNQPKPAQLSSVHSNGNQSTNRQVNLPPNSDRAAQQRAMQQKAMLQRQRLQQQPSSGIASRGGVSDRAANIHNRTNLPQRQNEHSLVGHGNVNKVNAKRNEFVGNNIRQKAMMTLNNELNESNQSNVVNSNNHHRNLSHNNINNNKNRQSQNVNYSLKDSNLSKKIGDHKRNSFDTDSQQNHMNRKTNNNGQIPQHHQQNRPQTASTSHTNHIKSLHQIARSAGTINRSSNPMPHQSPGVSQNPNHLNYSNHRANTPSNNHSYNNLNHSPNYNQQKPSSNQNSPVSPDNYLGGPSNQRQVFAGSVPYNSGMPNQYQYHTQHLSSPRQQY